MQPKNLYLIISSSVSIVIVVVVVLLIVYLVPKNDVVSDEQQSASDTKSSDTKSSDTKTTDEQQSATDTKTTTDEQQSATDTPVAVTSIDCELNEWSEWSPCDKECDSGLQTRSRTIKTAPSNGGKQCGATSEQRSCNTQPCPVDCAVGPWGVMSPCDKPCGGGTQYRTRKILTQPAFGGKACPSTRQEQSCNTQACIVYQPHDFVQFTATGTDLPNQPVNGSLSDCVTACEANTSCVGFSRMKMASDTSSSECWLKQSLPNPTFENPSWRTFMKPNKNVPTKPPAPAPAPTPTPTPVPTPAPGVWKQSSVTKSVGGSGGSPRSLVCSEGSIATGLFGRSGTLIDNIGIRCSDGKTLGPTDGRGGSPFEINSTSGFDMVEVRAGSLIDSVAAAGQRAGGSGGTKHDLACDGGKVMGLNVRSGDLVDNIQVVCAKLTTTPPAPAPTPAPTNAIKTVDGKCWDIPNNDAKKNANIQIWDCNGTGAQRFSYNTDKTIKHIPSGLCVDIPGGNRVNGNQLILWDCNGGSNQKFTEQYGSTFCSIQHRAADKCIDIPNNNTSNGSKLQIWDRNGSSAQKFTYK